MVLSSPLALERLVQLLETGADDFVITSTDAHLSVRARLSIDVIESIEIGEARIIRGPGGNKAPIAIDWAHGTISNDDGCVRLSRIELRLLAELLEKHGQSVPRADLVARAWPGRPLHGSESDNALAVYVCMLRKRLAAIGLVDCVQTIRGTGYRLHL